MYKTINNGVKQMLDLEMDRLEVLEVTDAKVDDVDEQDELSLEDLEDVAGGGCGISFSIF